MDYGSLLGVCHISLVAEHSLSKRKVVGSIPTYGFYFVWFVCFVCLFWKERRQVRPICARHEKKWCPAPAPTICLGAFSFFVLFCLTLLMTVKTAGTSCERRWCNGQHRCLPSNGSGATHFTIELTRDLLTGVYGGEALFFLRWKKTKGSSGSKPDVQHNY